MSDMEKIEEKLADYDVLLVDKNETITDFSKYEDRLHSDFKSFMAKQEFEFIKKRLKEGKEGNAIKGKWVNGQPTYGYFYDKNTKTIIPDTSGDPSPADDVKMVYEWAYNGEIISDIAYKLNKKGIYTLRGNYWSNTAIQRMLRQEVYLGRSVYGKSSGSGHVNKKTSPLKSKERSEWIVINNAHEPLINEEVYEDVQQQLSRRKKVIATRKSKTSTLSGLVRCRQCGSGLYIQRKDDKTI